MSAQQLPACSSASQTKALSSTAVLVVHQRLLVMQSALQLPAGSAAEALKRAAQPWQQHSSCQHVEALDRAGAVRHFPKKVAAAQVSAAMRHTSPQVFAQAAGMQQPEPEFKLQL
jgi:hypothetical protein